jgi:hypothetical protein
MALICRIAGHRPSPDASAPRGSMRGNCARCGASLLRYGHRDWRQTDVALRRATLRTILYGGFRKLICRLGGHSVARGRGRWVNDADGSGYHVAPCRHCDARLVRYPGANWRVDPGDRG